MDGNLRKIREKLARGEKLSIEDLHSLDPLHDAIFDNDGRVVGIHRSSMEKNHDQLIGELNLDYLDRALLDGSYRRKQRNIHSSERLPRLVRYVGKLSTEIK